jgi:hypothetical protein
MENKPMQSIQSIQAERAFKKEAAEKYQIVNIPRQTVIRASLTIGINRRRTALEPLLHEYRSIEAIPTGEIIDKLFGLDAVIQIGTQIIGVDVTLDPTSIGMKRQKLMYLASAHRALGIHFTTVYCPSIHKGIRDCLK